MSRSRRIIYFSLDENKLPICGLVSQKKKIKYEKFSTEKINSCLTSNKSYRHVARGVAQQRRLCLASSRSVSRLLTRLSR